MKANTFASTVVFFPNAQSQDKKMQKNLQAMHNDSDDKQKNKFRSGRHDNDTDRRATANKSLTESGRTVRNETV